jgi:hypothetical protein
LLCKEPEGGIAGSYADWRGTQHSGKRFPQTRLFYSSLAINNAPRTKRGALDFWRLSFVYVGGHAVSRREAIRRNVH